MANQVPFTTHTTLNTGIDIILTLTITQQHLNTFNNGDTLIKIPSTISNFPIHPINPTFSVKLIESNYLI